ncbi:MAG: hypothetical protein LBI94_06235 [Treponema sp.]|jgi:hypothetical protein|nr:hypothetical protein [Treponema sp.]
MNLLTVLSGVIIAIILLWFGYTLFFRLSRPGEKRGDRHGGQNRRGVRKDPETGGIEGKPGDPQTCPVCSAKLPPGRLVRSAVYPSLGGKAISFADGRDQLMHIMGCPYCLEGKPEQRRRRVCPVCHKPITGTEYLFARIFNRPDKSHIHILGCINCRGPKAMR